MITVTLTPSSPSEQTLSAYISQHMAPLKQRSVGRVVKGSLTVPPTSESTHAINTRGFAALADEIYLEIVSHMHTRFHSSFMPSRRMLRSPRLPMPCRTLHTKHLCSIVLQLCHLF